MKTALVEGVRRNLEYRTSTDMYTRKTAPRGGTHQFGADIFTVLEDEAYIVLVPTSGRCGGSYLKNYTTVITRERWSELVAMHSTYNGIRFHDAVMLELGFK